MFDFFKNIYDLLSNLEFWLSLLRGFKAAGPLYPIILTMIEAFFPILPLVAIVAFNVASHGYLWGFIYSWLGSVLGAFLVFSFFKRLRNYALMQRIIGKNKINRVLTWVAKQNMLVLFVLSTLPFTPSSLINISFGLAKYKSRDFLITIFLAKIIMISSLAFFGNTLVFNWDRPLLIIIAIIMMIGLYLLSIYINHKSGIDKIDKN
ncbi:MAG: VTT domain-containing protein [Erysipelotrichaceae bacterium]|nr:VTT domain-containing protein [Erysipelotrichaceae bacterium]